MSIPPSKGELLSSQLDFEDIDGSSPVKKVDFTTAVQVAIPPPPALKASPVVSLPPLKMDARLKRNISTMPKKKERLTQTIAALALLALAIASALIYVYGGNARNVSALSYATLPQIIIGMDGTVARLQVSVQIDKEDGDWLKQHKKELENIFQKSISGMNPDDLRSSDGIAATQLALKQELNTAMHAEKVQAVLITELQVQAQE